MNEQLLSLFQSELVAFSEHRAAFAEAMPQLGAHLRQAFSDPDLARLEESFAFMMAKLRYQFEHDRFERNHQLLMHLYPHYFLPTPAGGMVRLMPKKPEITHLPRHTRITIEQTPSLTFSTCVAMDIVPIAITSVKYERYLSDARSDISENAKAKLTVTLAHIHADQSITPDMLRNLRVYLDLSLPLANSLYDALLDPNARVHAKNAETHSKEVSVRSCGLTDAESFLPFNRKTPKAYRLFSEAIAFPRKFLFVQFEGMETFRENSQQVTLSVYLCDYSSALANALHSTRLQLNVCPSINLFARKGETFRIAAFQDEYPVRIDEDLPLTASELYDITDLAFQNNPDGKGNYTLLPQYDADATVETSCPIIYWQLIRKPLWMVGEYHLKGSATFLRFSDTQAAYQQTGGFSVTANAWYTNREAPMHLHPDATLAVPQEYQESIEPPVLVGNLSTPNYPEYTETEMWQLLAHLLQATHDNSDSTSACQNLRSVLARYEKWQGEESRFPAESILNVSVKRVVRRLPRTGVDALATVLHYQIKVDTERLFGQSIHLFGQLLATYFAGQTPINCFSEVTLMDKYEKVLGTWK